MLAAAPGWVPTAGASGRLHGPDVSKYQHTDGRLIDWGAVKRSGSSFAIIKASGGSNRTDPWFAREWAAAGRAGMVRGAYHYADPSQPADEQAAHVVEVVGTTREAGDLPIALDLESTGGLSPKALAVWAHTFLDGVERRTGRLPLLYTYVSFWQHQMANNRTFGAYPLWLARYSATSPAPLAGWTQWTFWQHTSSARVAGIRTRVDESYLCCSAGTLAALSDGRSGPIVRLWKRLGGSSGVLGLPTGAERAVTGGWGQPFQHGWISTSRATGSHAVTGSTWQRWLQTGGATGPLGLPTGDLRTVAGSVTQQLFVGGRIVSSDATGAHSLRGALLGRWVRDGAVRSPEGLPTSEASAGVQQFVRAGFYVNGAVRVVPGAIRDRYESLGGTGSPLGLPTTDAQRVLGGGTSVSFQRGLLVDVVVSGAHTVV